MTDVLIYLDENIKQAREAVEQLLVDFQPPVAESIAFLRSPEAEQMVSWDPYWPKWDSPWWHVLLLCELEASALVPAKFWAGYKAVVERHYLPFFPFRAEEVPAGKDPLSVVACHCYLGCLVSCDLAIAPSVSGHSGTPQWIRDWFLRYQNADGGLNCDEDKYLKEQPTSSVVSTVPCLEAVLADAELSQAAWQFADGAAQYLSERRLCRSKRTGELINEGWLEPAFPRFYHYDVLRGLSVLTRWALKRGRKISRTVLEEALAAVACHMTDCGLVPRRSHTQGLNSRFPLPGGGFEGGEASRFALLDYVDRPGMPSLPLTREWLGLLLRLKYMADARLLAR